LKLQLNYPIFFVAEKSFVKISLLFIFHKDMTKSFCNIIRDDSSSFPSKEIKRKANKLQNLYDHNPKTLHYKNPITFKIMTKRLDMEQQSFILINFFIAFL
jgi:hypothetical protein